MWVFVFVHSGSQIAGCRTLKFGSRLAQTRGLHELDFSGPAQSMWLQSRPSPKEKLKFLSEP